MITYASLTVITSIFGSIATVIAATAAVVSVLIGVHNNKKITDNTTVTKQINTMVNGQHERLVTHLEVVTGKRDELIDEREAAHGDRPGE